MGRPPFTSLGQVDLNSLTDQRQSVDRKSQTNKMADTDVSHHQGKQVVA